MVEAALTARLIWRGNTVYPRALHLRLLFQGACVFDAPLLDESGEPLAEGACPLRMESTASGFRLTGSCIPLALGAKPAAGGLLYTENGWVCLPYTAADGSFALALAPFPAALTTLTFDPPPRPLPGETFASPAAALAALFSRIPLAPAADWAPPPDAPPGFRTAFNAALDILRMPASERWAVRGEPDHFLILGARAHTGWRAAMLTVARGKPAVLTLRCEDLIRALPAPEPTRNLTLEFSGDGTSPERVEAAGWDTRLRLPLAPNGGALVHLTAHRA